MFRHIRRVERVESTSVLSRAVRQTQHGQSIKCSTCRSSRARLVEPWCSTGLTHPCMGSTRVESCWDVTSQVKFRLHFCLPHWLCFTDNRWKCCTWKTSSLWWRRMSSGRCLSRTARWDVWRRPRITALFTSRDGRMHFELWKNSMAP